MNNYGITLSDDNYQKPGADTKIVKCFQREIDLSDQSETKISNYFTDTVKDLTEVEFYKRKYQGIEDEVKCADVGLIKLDLYKEIRDDLKIKDDKGEDNKGKYIKFYGNDYNLGNIYYKSSTPNKFDISNYNWPIDNLVGVTFKGCSSQIYKNDDNIINNKYVHAEYDIINDTPVFDYLYFLAMA